MAGITGRNEVVLVVFILALSVRRVEGVFFCITAWFGRRLLRRHEWSSHRHRKTSDTGFGDIRKPIFVIAHTGGFRQCYAADHTVMNFGDR